jgi:AraC-like DNA-binding protein
LPALTLPNNSSLATPQNSFGIQLPSGTPAIAHVLIHGADIGLFYADLDPVTIEMHSHRSHVQVSLLFKGAVCDLTWRAAGNEVQEEQLKGAQLCIVAPKVEHGLCWKEKAGMVTFYVRPSFLRKFDCADGALQGVHVEDLAFVAGRDALTRHLTCVFEALCADRAVRHDREFVIAAGRVLTGRLLKFHSEGTRRGRRDGRLSRSQQRAVNQFMECNLHRGITVDDLTELVSLSKAHFIRLFTRTYGEPPVRNHLVRRLQCAEEMLIRTDCTILDAVEHCGFCDQSYFNRAFLKYLNYRPGALLHLRAKLPQP